MPARSASQQRLFGMVRAHQQGKLKNASPKIDSMATRISAEDAHDFAATKHDGLPEKKAQFGDEMTSSEDLARAAGNVLGVAAGGLGLASLPLAGGALGLAKAPVGYRTESTGRGALRGAGTAGGALIGGIGGAAAGPAIASALGSNMTPGLGALIGGVGGGLIGYSQAGKAMGRPRWEEMLNRRAVYRADHGYREKESSDMVVGINLVKAANGMMGGGPPGSPGMGGGGGGGIVFAGRPASPKLGPMPDNPVTQLDGNAAGGPGQGGAATAEAVQAQLPQAQQQAGMVQTMPSPHAQQTQAQQPAPQQGMPQQGQPPMQPQGGFMPNQQGQTVYPPGQGPVTGLVPKMGFMRGVEDKPMQQSSLGEGNASDLAMKPRTVNGPEAFENLTSWNTRKPSPKVAHDYSQLYTIADGNEFLTSFIDTCAKENYSPAAVQKAASECSLVSDEMAGKLRPLCKLAAIPGASFLRGAGEWAASKAPKLFGRGMEAGAGAAPEMGSKILGSTVTTNGAEGAFGAAGRSLVPRGLAGAGGAGAGAAEAGAGRASQFMSGAGQMGKQLATRGAWGGAGYLGGGAIDKGTEMVTGQDPGIRNYAGAAGLVGARGVAGYGMGGALDVASQAMTGGHVDPHLRDVGALAGGASNFAGPMAEMLPGAMGRAAGGAERFAQGVMDPRNMQRLLGGGPEMAAGGAERMGQQVGTNLDRAAGGVGLGMAGKGIRDNTAAQANAIQTDPRQAAGLDLQTEQNHPGYLAQKQQYISQAHPGVMQAVQSGDPHAAIQSLPDLLSDPATAAEAAPAALGAWEKILTTNAQQGGINGMKAQKALEGLHSMKQYGVDQMLGQGLPGYTPGNPQAAASAAASPQGQAHQEAMGGLWQWFQGLDPTTQVMLGVGLVTALGGLFTEKPGLALGGAALAAAPAFFRNDPYGVQGMMGMGQQPGESQSQAVNAPPMPGMQPPQAQQAPPPQGLGFHPHQAMPGA